MRSCSWSWAPAGLVLVLFAIGCGRSPASPRAPVQMVRVDTGAPVAVVCPCEDDDDEDEGDEAPRRPPVQYVRMTEWQPPPSVQRIESEIVPRGEQPVSYVKFPPLTLHRPVGDTSIRWAYRVRRASSAWSSPQPSR